MKKYVIALDEGTTSARTVLIDREGNVLARFEPTVDMTDVRAAVEQAL